MDKRQKEAIYNKHKTRSERDIVTNKGVDVPFGKTSIGIKALSWTKSNEFEDVVKAAFTKLSGVIKADTGSKSFDLDKVFNIMTQLLREDLLNMANKATCGLVTLKFIEEHEATKNDVMGVVVKAFEVNYKYVKNLIALSRLR